MRAAWSSSPGRSPSTSTAPSSARPSKSRRRPRSTIAQRQLGSAGCTLADVFKVNIYLADLADWARFNAVYEAVMPEPLPVRTAVQAVLLPGFLVEIEMWAVKSRD